MRAQGVAAGSSLCRQRELGERVRGGRQILRERAPTNVVFLMC